MDFDEQEVQRQAAKWLDSLDACWGTEDFPPYADHAWRNRRFDELGFGQWPDASREELLHSATDWQTPDREAFAALALQHWPEDFLAGESFWLLPYQLAFVRLGVPLDEGFLPAGVSRSLLPLTRLEKIVLGFG